VGRRHWTLLGILASLWGASYLFIKLGLEDFSPAMVVFLRTLLAALVLLPLALHRKALAGLRERWSAIVVLAAIQVAGPFLLISWGEEEISSSLAGILVASAPIITAFLAIWVDHAERPSRVGTLGIGIGIVGVVLLLGVDVGGESAALLGGLAVLLASVGYAIGGFLIKSKMKDMQPIGVVTSTMATSALLTVPLVLVTFPTEAPHLKAVAAMAALGAGGTGVAFVIFYGLIADLGPSKASIVAYIAPVFALFYGVAFLDEAFTLATVAGMLLILGGSWLAGEGKLPRGVRTGAAAPAGPERPPAPEAAA
jgi:drug/metabolite transporter (DMT)-like permease